MITLNKSIQLCLLVTISLPYYSPDYLCMAIFNSFKEAIHAGKLLPEEVKMLRGGLQEVAGMEAVLNYGCPSVERWLGGDCFVVK